MYNAAAAAVFNRIRAREPTGTAADSTAPGFVCGLQMRLEWVKTVGQRDHTAPALAETRGLLVSC